MNRHHELIALRVRAERCTKETEALRVLVSQLEDELARAKRLPDDHFAELVDLSIALVEWERLPWWRRIWTTPKAMLLLDGAS